IRAFHVTGVQTCALPIYLKRMPEASFIDFYWGWRSIVQSVISTLQAPIPKAKLYHAISTGYAGLFQARAHLETRRRTVVTEHGKIGRASCREGGGERAGW